MTTRERMQVTSASYDALVLARFQGQVDTIIVGSYVWAMIVTEYMDIAHDLGVACDPWYFVSAAPGLLTLHGCKVHVCDACAPAGFVGFAYEGGA